MATRVCRAWYLINGIFIMLNIGSGILEARFDYIQVGIVWLLAAVGIHLSIRWIWTGKLKQYGVER